MKGRKKRDRGDHGISVDVSDTHVSSRKILNSCSGVFFITPYLDSDLEVPRLKRVRHSDSEGGVFCCGVVCRGRAPLPQMKPSISRFKKNEAL
jgi:hypothetical protein